ncbi:MAG: AAA family ATPase [Armatimonadota bacterium]|nr:AAA family ATPase [Armatimonadota bacterium]MDR7550958.1 AAA family ATPase [Armatimonadota bacterium]
MRKVLYEVKRVIVGQDLMLERLLVALLARGHVLIEGVPGLAKTLAIKSTARAIDCDFKRIQFTPDLVPADLVGTRIFNQRTNTFETELGPLFANFVLADEINRAPAKVQSALLEAMQERQVTIGKQTFHLPEPFLVMATQNPIESEGTYPLPEAQVDRFMFKVVIGYPSYHEEVTVVERMSSNPPEVGPVISAAELKELQAVTDAVYVDPKIREYAVALATATRRPQEVGLERLRRYVAYGASPRASLNMVLGGRALALLRGRDYVMPEDIRDLAPEVLRHRMVLSYEALADEITADAIIEQTIGAVAIPRLALGDPLERERLRAATADGASEGM